MPSELPSAVLNSHHGDSAIAAVPATPAQRPPKCAASTNTPASASRPPARATISHSAGAAPPASANGVVNSTGNGFHDGPLEVSSAKCPLSRPHTIHAQGSKASAHGSSSESAARTSAAATSAAPRNATSRLTRASAAVTSAQREAGTCERRQRLT